MQNAKQVEAMVYDGSNATEIYDWLGSADIVDAIPAPKNGDYIVKLPDGSVQHMTQAEFNATHKPPAPDARHAAGFAFLQMMVDTMERYGGPDELAKALSSHIPAGQATHFADAINDIKANLSSAALIDGRKEG